MFSINVDKLIKMTDVEEKCYSSTVNAILNKCDEQCRTIAVIGEGLSAFKLASSFMESGKKVLFVDADTATDIFISKYRLGKNLSGVTDYLDGEAQAEKIICKTNKSNLDVVFTGNIENVEIAYRIESKMPKMLAEYAESYDLIVMLSDVDGDMAAFADATVVIMERSEYSEAVAEHTVRLLDEKGCYVLGVVINE